MEMIRHDSRAWDPNWKNLVHYNNYLLFWRTACDEACAASRAAAESLRWDISGVPTSVSGNIAREMDKFRRNIQNGVNLATGFIWRAPELASPAPQPRPRRKRRKHRARSVFGLDGGLNESRKSSIISRGRWVPKLDLSTFGMVTPKRRKKPIRFTDRSLYEVGDY